MKSYIKAIIIFNNKGEKRIVPLMEGVNIITGESKTGKSSLVEIIDYCMCSNRCTIPKGKITDFSSLYVLIMSINNNNFIIARQNWSNGGKMYFVKESNNFEPMDFDISYFDDKNLMNNKDVQYELEYALGLYVTNMSTDSDQQSKKASLRNMVSFIFQHQNLMASKFALFYRFSDYYKRKDVIDQFPVFAGMISQEYYSDLIRLDNLKSQLKQKLKKQKANEKGAEYIKENLQPLLSNYFSLLGKDFDCSISAQGMLELAYNLPEFDDSQLCGESKIVERYSKLKNELELLRDEEREILLKIKSIKSATNAGNDFNSVLKALKQQTSIANIETKEYKCPLCGQDCEEIAKNDIKIVQASEWLDNELLMTEKYTIDFSEDVRKLEESHSQIVTKIRGIWTQIKEVEKKFLSSKDLITKREKVNYAKARIVVCAEMNISGIFEMVDHDIEELEEQIKVIDERIKGFGVDKKKKDAQDFISKNMNKLARTLDFEKDYYPIDLKFGLMDESFDLYHNPKKGEKIHLYEMGSGANWVSCHIALFLSFLRYFATQLNSPMPLFMFFDQPSQVYFPQDNTKGDIFKQSDIQAVNKMYKTIFEEIKSIAEDTGILPQIIIVDHVDGNVLEVKEEFKTYVRCNWRDGQAFI